MKKTEAQSRRPAGENLEAPVRLTPEQLETVAAGFKLQITQGGKGSTGGTATTGAYPTQPVLKLF